MATLKAVKVTVTPDGRIESDHPLRITRPTRVILTMVEEVGEDSVEFALASEEAFARDWNRPEEDEAWAYLQEETSS